MENNRIGTIVVAGGGISGIRSALDLARSGYKVYLVEKAPSIGGMVSQTHSTYPHHQNALCQLMPEIDAVYRHPNITIITNAELSRIQGDAGNFEIKVTKHPARVNEDCTACGDCMKVCPIKPYDTFNEGLTLRTAIDIHNANSIPPFYNIEKETPVCTETCPVHIDIRKYVGLVAERKFLEALQVVREKNPLPAICGRVCHHPCEAACNRGKYDQPVAIDAIKRFAADYELNLRKEGKSFLPPAPKKTKKSKVAIIGAGPAGLTVGHDLALLGYNSTIYEESPVPGGMLWLGIPEYRLPRDIINIEVDYIKNLGVDLKLNTPINKDFTIDDLFKNGYKAVFIGVGAHKGLKLRVPGEDDYEGFLDCVIFLRRVNLGDKDKPGKKVIVIGGGNSAIDSARTALRLGSDEVYILYRRSRKEMPANSWEIDAAEEEGVKIHYLAAPVKILGSNGKVTGMLCTKMQLGKLDASGRRRPIPIEGSEFEIEADCIVPAISQEPDISFLHEGHGLEISRWNSFVIDRNGATNRPGVFSGGDCDTGPATVIEAIAAGHVAARSIDKFLSTK